MSLNESPDFGEKMSVVIKTTKEVLGSQLSRVNGGQNDDNHQNNGINSDDDSIQRVLEGYVGIDSLPEQFVNRLVREGFSFNIMVLGETGVGKSTLLETLFDINFPDVSTKTNNLSAVDVTAYNYDLKERSIRLKLGLIESKGFGDQIIKTDSSKSIVQYIDQQFEKYLQEELKTHRNLSPSKDSRVHVCLYLISPIGHGLKAIDLETMKKLDNKTNLIPVMAKSDTITKQELDKLRAKIMSDIVSNGIYIYQFPIEDPDVGDLNSENNSMLPFAVVASHEFVRVGDKQMRARQYPWGTVQVENQSHCDFVRLRDMILRINMEDLRETTHLRHYELYRRFRLEQMGYENTKELVTKYKTISFQEGKYFEEFRDKHISEMKRKEEELKQKFVLRIKEKEAELKVAENEMIQKFDDFKNVSLNQKKCLKMEKQKLEEQIKAFNARKANFWAEYCDDCSKTLDEMIKEKVNNN